MNSDIKRKGERAFQDFRGFNSSALENYVEALEVDLEEANEKISDLEQQVKDLSDTLSQVNDRQ